MLEKSVRVSAVVLTAVKINREDGGCWLERWDGKTLAGPTLWSPSPKPRKGWGEFLCDTDDAFSSSFVFSEIISSIF